MTSQLHPFTATSHSLPQLQIPFSSFAAHVLPVLFWVIIGIWFISSSIAAYHWLRYHRRSIMILPAFIIYGIGSFILIIYAASGFIG